MDVNPHQYMSTHTSKSYKIMDFDQDSPSRRSVLWSNSKKMGWDGLWGKLRKKCASALINHIFPTRCSAITKTALQGAL